MIKRLVAFMLSMIAIVPTRTPQLLRKLKENVGRFNGGGVEEAESRRGFVAAWPNPRAILVMGMFYFAGAQLGTMLSLKRP